MSHALRTEDECVQRYFLRLIPCLELKSEIKHLKWLKVQSSTIRDRSLVLITYDVGCPVFGKVLDILCVNLTCLLYVQVYIGELFSSHYNGFVI